MIEIKNDLLSIGILPETGGSFSYMKYKEQDVLRPSKIPESEANFSAMFPMLPYASFIQDGHFPYFGITRFVPKNTTFSKFPLHGDVWRSKLQVSSRDHTSVVLSYQHNKNEHGE